MVWLTHRFLKSYPEGPTSEAKKKKSSRAKHLTRFYQSLTLPKDPTCLYLFSFCKAIMFIQLRFNPYFSPGCQHPTCGGFVEHINLIIVFSSVRLNDPKLTTKVSVQKKNCISSERCKLTIRKVCSQNYIL